MHKYVYYREEIFELFDKNFIFVVFSQYFYL